MAENPLFYRSITPLNREAHRDLGLTTRGGPYGFARTSHVIPALVEEFGAAARHLPIVFLPGTAGPSPVFLVGLKTGRSDLVGADGTWMAGYIPAFLRRYPFMFGEIEGRDPVICIDDSYDGLSREDGDKLFDETGAETDLLKTKIRFVNEYYVSAKRSEVLGRRVQEHDLLRSIALEAKHPDGSSTSMQGLFAVDEAKLASLSDQAYLQLRTDGLIGPIFAHLLSLGAVERLTNPISAAVSTNSRQ